jgi:hypothetical protein
MALTTCSVTTSVIAALDDLPNDVGGLTAAQLKAKFDEFGTNFVAWFNDTHLPEVDAHLSDTAPHEYMGGRIFVSTAAKSYYVNPVSGDDNNPGTSSQPFKTIAKAVSLIPITINYGHTISIYLASGEYNEPLLLEDFNCISSLLFRIDSNVVLKGTTPVGDFTSGAAAGICIRNCCGHIGFIDNPINLISGDIGALHYIGLAVRHSLLSGLYGLSINIDGDDVTATGEKYGVYTMGSTARISQSAISNLKYGIFATYNSSVHSHNNTGTENETALFAYRGSVISKEGSQPAGTAGESTAYGGVIR